jgi:hypothetical protein
VKANTLSKLKAQLLFIYVGFVGNKNVATQGKGENTTIGAYNHSIAIHIFLYAFLIKEPNVSKMM